MIQPDVTRGQWGRRSSQDAAKTVKHHGGEPGMRQFARTADPNMVAMQLTIGLPEYEID